MKTNTASRLKQIMSERGLKQVDIINKSLPFQRSLHIKLGKSALSQYVNGKQSPDQDKIYLLSKTLNVNEAWLMGFDVPRQRDKQLITEAKANSSSYNYFDVGLSAGALCEVSPFKNTNVKQLTLPDDVMGKYAGSPDIILSRVNGESMNRVIPDGSLIAIEKVNSVFDIKNGDIVVFQDCSEMAIKRFYNNKLKRTIIFTPDSTNSSFTPMSYSYDDLANVQIIGRVVVYIVSI